MTREAILAGYHQHVIPEYTIPEREFDLANLIATRALPFSLVDQELFQKLTGLTHDRNWITQKIAQLAQTIRQTQFNQMLPYVDIYDRETCSLFTDGWEMPNGTHVWAFMIATAHNIYFVGLKVSESSVNAFWLAKTIHDIIIELQEKKQMVVVALCTDNASVIKCAHKMLQNQVTETYGVLTDELSIQVVITRTIPHFMCVCHSADLAIRDYVIHYDLKKQILLACKQLDVEFSYCPTRWFSLYETMILIQQKDKNDFYELKKHTQVIKLMSQAIGMMEGNEVTQTQVKIVMDWLKDDLYELNNSYANEMLTILVEREKKHFQLHYDIAKLQLVLQHDTQVTLVELRNLIVRLNLSFGLHMDEICIWEYKNKAVSQEDLQFPLKTQYARICKQTSYMCRIMECLVASEAEIERINSHMRRQIHYQRSQLSPSTIENLLYVKYSNFTWIQFKEAKKKVTVVQQQVGVI
ncbi:Conserved_hypothetical protein [Hexamita inflata]|uniref:DUF659 domain-containing protein n=1 Tax=Hexamita inflata TaxID=28002 RepID=A0AA86NJX8_9EUKA|nr:Conserved hypothetical protein [Hexamita inflata]